MANPLRAELTIKLGGKEYTLRPTFEAMCEFEELVDLSALGVMARLQNLETARLVYLSAAIWTGMKGFVDYEPSKLNLILTHAEIGKMIQEQGFTDFLAPVTQYLSNALMTDEKLAELADASVKNSDGPEDTMSESNQIESS